MLNIIVKYNYKQFLIIQSLSYEEIIIIFVKIQFYYLNNSKNVS